ncbi:hypothetical protein D3Z58_00200 [Clostridiaceae bacterium]|nr:hypothetical protein [Clostridiaceae bacterium]
MHKAKHGGWLAYGVSLAILAFLVLCNFCFASFLILHSFCSGQSKNYPCKPEFYFRLDSYGRKFKIVVEIFLCL